MKIEKHGKTSDYVNFVIMGLKNYERAEKVIESIDVFHRAINVKYNENPDNITELLDIHDHIQDYGMESFISIADMKNGNSIQYSLEE